MSSKALPYYAKNFFIPPLSQDHVDKIFANHIQNCTSLTFSISTYLKELAYCHYQMLRADMSEAQYELDSRDLALFLTGEDAPFALIIASCFIADQRFCQIVNQVCLPPDCDIFLRYNGILQNRLYEGSHLIDPFNDKSTIKIFDFLCDRPFFSKEDYFVSGVETSKLLYKRTVEEIDKLLDFDVGPQLNKAG